MEAGPGEKDTLSIGRYVFSATGFRKAIAHLRNNMHKPGLLIIDEIGPLELRGNGFKDVLEEILKERTGDLLIVVRENLVDEVVRKFGITGHIIIKKPAELEPYFQSNP